VTRWALFSIVGKMHRPRHPSDAGIVVLREERSELSASFPFRSDRTYSTSELITLIR